MKILLLSVFCCASLFATTLDDVRDYLSQPEEDINLFVTKLLIDHIIDPSFSIHEYIQKMTQYVHKIWEYSPYIEGEDLTSRINKIRKFIFEKGEWNNFQNFKYDFVLYFEEQDHPLNCDLLYLTFEGKKGRCITLAVLYYTVLDMLGYPVSMGIEPNHMFVLFEGTDDPKNDIHLEASNFGMWNKRTEMIKRLPIKSILSKAYTRRLSKRESGAALLGVLSTQYIYEEKYIKALEVCELIQEYIPTNIDNLMNIGHCYLQFYYRERNPEIKERYRLLANYYEDLGKMLGFDRDYAAESESEIKEFLIEKKKREKM